MNKVQRAMHSIRRDHETGELHPMDKKVKGKWVEALKSGKYAQGQQRLHHPEQGTYCCLGVLAELVDPDEDICSWVPEDMLPEALLEETNVDHQAAEHLATLNDEGTPFDEIADVIERYL